MGALVAVVQCMKWFLMYLMQFVALDSPSMYEYFKSGKVFPHKQTQ